MTQNQTKRACLRGSNLSEGVARTCEHIRRNEASNLAELLSELEVIQDLANEAQKKLEGVA